MKIHFLKQKFLEHRFAWLIIFLFSAVLFTHGYFNNFIPCEKDCGETFIALHQARNSYITGAKYLWLENLASSPDVINHAFLYTHSVNIGNFVFLLCEKIGLISLWQKQLITLLITILGLFHVYLCVFKVGKDRFLAIFTLFLFCISYNQVFSFGLNALRSWHWLALFGSLYYVQNMMDNFKIKNCLLVLLFSFISFGCGYDFWIIVFLSSLFLSAFFMIQNSKIDTKIITFLVLCFSIPFILRQIHIVLVLGYEYWSTDFYYTFLSKVPFITNILDYPSSEKINEFYQNYNILRPYSLPEKSISSVWGTFWWMFRDIAYPNYGMINCIVVIISLVISIRICVKEKESDCFYKMSVFYLSICIGIVFGLFIFSPFSFHVYLKHEFPLLGAIFYLSTTNIIFVVKKYFENRNLEKILMASFAINMIIVQFENINHRTPIDTSWIKFVSAHKNNTYAVSWFNSALAPFTQNWVLPLTPGIQDEVVSNVKQNLAPFDKKMTICFGEKNKEQAWNEYLKPDFWVYFDTTQQTKIRKDQKRINIDQFVASLPDFNVVEQTNNHVIFDLRPYWKACKLEKTLGHTN